MWPHPHFNRSDYVNIHGTELALCILLFFLIICVILIILSVKNQMILIACIPINILTLFQLYKIIKGANTQNSLICEFLYGDSLPIQEEEPRRQEST